jgi:hypothetical protein
LLKEIWRGEGTSTSEVDDEQPYHVITTADASPKNDLQTWKRLRAQAKRKELDPEMILVGNRQSYAALMSPKTLDDTSFNIAEHSLSRSRVGYEFKHQSGRNTKDFQDQSFNFEACCPGPDSQSFHSPQSVARSLTTCSIYRKLYQRFLARRILYHRPTILNRRTSVNLREANDSTAEKDDDVWELGTCAERAHRTLQLLGIEMSHTPITWSQHQFIETNRWGKYRCYRPSFLRWSWTMVEGRSDDIFPIGEE